MEIYIKNSFGTLNDEMVTSYVEVCDLDLMDIEYNFCTLKDDLPTCDVEFCVLDLMDIAPCQNRNYLNQHSLLWMDKHYLILVMKTFLIEFPVGKITSQLLGM